MADLARIYAGRVSHVRHTPFRHKFTYLIWMLAADLDRLDELGQSSAWFAHNRFGLLSIQDKDHGYRDGGPLRGFVEAALARENLSEFAAQITFITMPRLLGYAFNPISFYYCHNAAGQLGAVLHQVKNTFGDQVGYLMPVTGTGTIRQSAPKRMHVSPFFDMRGGYRFALTAPAERLNVVIQYGAAGQARMTAAMALKYLPWSAKTLTALSFQMPLVPLKVIFAIHWQALKLWIKGAKFHGVPEQPHDPIIAGDVL